MFGPRPVTNEKNGTPQNTRQVSHSLCSVFIVQFAVTTRFASLRSFARLVSSRRVPTGGQWLNIHSAVRAVRGESTRTTRNAGIQIMTTTRRRESSTCASAAQREPHAFTPPAPLLLRIHSKQQIPAGFRTNGTPLVTAAATATATLDSDNTERTQQLRQHSTNNSASSTSRINGIRCDYAEPPNFTCVATDQHSSLRALVPLELSPVPRVAPPIQIPSVDADAQSDSARALPPHSTATASSYSESISDALSGSTAPGAGAALTVRLKTIATPVVSYSNAEIAISSNSPDSYLHSNLNLNSNSGLKQKTCAQSVRVPLTVVNISSSSTQSLVTSTSAAALNDFRSQPANTALQINDLNATPRAGSGNLTSPAAAHPFATRGTAAHQSRQLSRMEESALSMQRVPRSCSLLF